MESQKRDLKENYVYGFVTGLGLTSFAAMFYVRWVLSELYYSPTHMDYSWYLGVMGITTWLMMFALVAAFGGLMLGLSTIKESTMRETNSLIEESHS